MSGQSTPECQVIKFGREESDDLFKVSIWTSKIKGRSREGLDGKKSLELDMEFRERKMGTSRGPLKMCK